MPKILHCADLHLDSPFLSGDIEKSEIRRNELRGTFSSMMLYAKTNNIDIMLMAGDIFDTRYVTRETVALVNREFAANPGCRFVISPGNHDPYTENSVYQKTDFPDNVYIFDSENLSYFSFPELNTDVYGYAFTSPGLTFNPFAQRSPKSGNTINLLCAHGDMTSPISVNCPITLSDIRDSGFDYIALGHIHNSGGIERIGNTYYGYSGCLEGRDFGETGHKGAIYAEISKSGGVLSVTAKGLRFSKRRYENETLNMTGAATQEDIISRIKALASEKKYGTDTSLRVTLEGDVSPSLTVSENILKNVFAGSFFFLEIVDRTLPLFNYETLKNDPTIKGAFFEKFIQILKEGNPEERKIAAKALRIGLTALDGGDITQVE